MKYLACFAVLGLFASPAMATDKPIEGGFGIKLGEPIEQRLVDNCQENEKATFCVLKPDTTHPVYGEYLVALEPKESRVMYIEASTLLADGCDTVKEKLGAMYSSEYYNFQQQPYLWGYGDKTANLRCQEVEGGYKLSFHIVDNELQSKS